MSLLFGLVLCVAAVGDPIQVRPGELASALEAAEPGQTLILQPGEHRGLFVISKSVVLKGVPGAIILGPGTGTVLRVQADDVQLLGLTVRGSGRDLGEDEAVVLLDKIQRSTVRDCVIQARAFGVYLKAGSHNQVIDNQVTGDAKLPQAQRGNGIHLWHTEKNEVRGNRISSTRDAIYLSFAHENEIIANHGTQVRYGIHYMYSERNHLQENVFNACVGGIALMFSKNNRINDNVTNDNERFGILCQMVERTQLEGNHVRGNGRGFFLENSADNSFERNVIRQNGVGLFLTAGSERNTIAGNIFDSNVVQVYRDRRSNNRWSRDKRGNYWSDYAGFDWDGDGIGEQPYQMDNGASSLMANFPAARWLWRSPLLLMVDWWEGHQGTASAEALDLYPWVLGGEAE